VDTCIKGTLHIDKLLIRGKKGFYTIITNKKDLNNREGARLRVEGRCLCVTALRGGGVINQGSMGGGERFSLKKKERNNYDPDF